MLNSIVLTGRLTADPEIRNTDNGTSVLSFSLAVQRNYKPKDEENYPVDFINLVAWRGTAEFISNYFKRGSLITVEGSLESRKYTDKDGNNRTAFEVKVDRAHFCDSGNRQNGNRNNAPASTPTPADFVADFSSVRAGDDDLPF